MTARTAQFIHGYLGYLLGQANHRLFQSFETQLRAAGLRSIEWRVLATLHDGPPLPIGQLAQAVLAKQPTVTKLVQRMAEQGWLHLQPDPSDQRCTVVSISPAGRRLVKPLVLQAKLSETQFLGALSADEVAQFKNLLRQLQ